jgi:hypothetical protein
MLLVCTLSARSMRVISVSQWLTLGTSPTLQPCCNVMRRPIAPIGSSHSGYSKLSPPTHLHVDDKTTRLGTVSFSSLFLFFAIHTFRVFKVSIEGMDFSSLVISTSRRPTDNVCEAPGFQRVPSRPCRPDLYVEMLQNPSVAMVILYPESRQGCTILQRDRVNSPTTDNKYSSIDKEQLLQL